MESLLSHLLRSRRSEVLVECRSCGTSVDGAPTACPTCGGTGFAEYEIPG